MDDIELLREGLEVQEIAGQHVWPLKITATSNVDGLDSRIFVYHAAMDDDDFLGNIFEVVASVEQMTDIPPDAPGVYDGEYQVPYYRKDELFFHCRTPLEAEELQAKVEEDVNSLVRNWKAMQNLSTQETTSWDGSFTY